ncbi:cystathionine beta-synthase-like [Sitophilus oryzae]|uniref:cystathionine beta-synthase n=1 Tax=Sitophilus oryzae TaxID=7048 RepID=A0A6J2YTM8_SITOR|nr:cystathionine beta-synthase-like [Sitophilus oryzae]XP_030766541.1 cystathionine beta-synthase-like [Sitophilus oryzae]XP_030766542.1 cystathionine beta-synthase-like [Sitophilus oryzae]
MAHVPPNELIFISPSNDKVFHQPGEPIKCKWRESLTTHIPSPHCSHDWKQKYPKLVFPDVLSMIGNTPMVKLNNIPKSAGVECNIYAKCEFVNPGGSVKDRMVKRIFEDAERQGLIKPGMTIIEQSSGNTGIAVALICALKGYKCIIVMSEKISGEKEAVITSLGASVVRCPVNAPLDAPDGMWGAAHRLRNEIPNSFIFDQFSHPGNPLTHYDTTALEILDQLDNKVDMIVFGGGTGGTVTGIGRKFREVSPHTKLVGFDPVGSKYACPASLNETDVTFFEIEGIGYTVVPPTLDQGVMDYWIKTTDLEALPMCRRLMREEGLLVGMSSGAALVAALKAAKGLKKGQNCVIMLPDSIRNYMTKFVSDRWMDAKGYQPCENKYNVWWWNQKVSDIKYNTPLIVNTTDSLEKALNLLQSQKRNEAAVVESNRNLVGTVDIPTIQNKILSQTLKPSDPVDRCTSRILPKLTKDSILGRAYRIIENDHFAIVIETTGSGGNKIETPIGVIYGEDIFNYAATKQN